jgi:hypothetical protein
MSLLTLEQVTSVLNKYYPGQEWRCAMPYDQEPSVFDEWGNIIHGIDWKDHNTMPKPTTAELHAHWVELEATGEYLRSWPAIPGDRRGGFYGKASEYAQACLQASDWAALPDVNLANQAEWDAYRSQLRSLRVNPQNVENWPQPPKATFNT